MRERDAKVGAGVAPAATTTAAQPERSGASPRVVTSDSLLAGDSQLAIRHEKTIYFLRLTRFGKLILTK